LFTSTNELIVEEPIDKYSYDVHCEVNDEISFISRKMHHMLKIKRDYRQKMIQQK